MPDDAVVGVDVELVIDEVGFVTTVVPPKIFGRFGIGAMFNEMQVDCNRFLMRPYSLESIDKPHRTFTAIQLPK